MRLIWRLVPNCWRCCPGVSPDVCFIRHLSVVCSRGAQVPDILTEEQVADALSHLPVWRALRRARERKGGPLRPLRIVKSAIQVYYSLLHSGVDGATQFLSSLRRRTLRFKWRQKVVMETLFQLAMNTVLAHRALQIGTTEWRGVDHYRSSGSRRSPFPEAILELACGLIHEAAARPSTTRTVPVQASPRPRPTLPRSERPPKKKAYRRLGWNMGDRKSWRLTNHDGHIAGVAASRLRCVVCGKQTLKKCVWCDAPLCQNKSRDCFHLFHTVDTIPSP